MTQRPRLTACLLEDAGAMASDGQFYRSAPFLRAEGATHTLVIGDGAVVMPIVRRQIPGGRGYDGISPYGYPGGLLRGEAPHVRDVDFSGTGLVSLFLRDRMIGCVLRGGTQRGVVMMHEPSRPRAVQRRVATKVRSNERAGYKFVPIPGPLVEAGLVDAFQVVYEQTMVRAQAARRYFFDAEYLRSCLSADSCWLATVRGPDGDLAAGALAVVSDGLLHYFLGGTADAHRATAPGKNLMVGMLDMADELGLPLNLGGGMSPGDHLEAFKAQFTNSSQPCLTHSIVVDEAAYAVFSDGAPSTDFFPAYRCSR